jgi:zinc protease
MPAKKSTSAPLSALPPDTRIITLENGLQIILREDHSAPVVSAQAWCKTGSIHENQWLGAGLSHVLEHMLFKGTHTRGAGRIDQEVQAAGGHMNAYTSFDRTVYYIDVPNTGAHVAIDILCDIMQHAALPEQELAKELDVIRREMDMGYDDPGQRSARRLFETAYTRSPYRFTIIGYPDIFNELKREDIYRYYTARYATNNIFFVIAGDVVAAEVEAQIKTAFVGAKARPMPPMVLPEEPRQLAPREVVEEAPIELAHLHFSWHVPDLRHPDVPVLDVMATILGVGRSSRLYQNVREKQGVVNSIDAWTYSPGNPGLFGMSAIVDADKFEAARQAALAEVEGLKTTRVSAAELNKAIKQFTAATLATRKTMSGQAQDLGSNWIAAGDLDFSARYLAAVKRITPADLQRVARTYLTAENRTFFALVPPGVKKTAAAVSETFASHAVKKFDLPHGLRLLLKENHRLPFVEFRLAMRGGVLAETAATSGSTQLLSKLLLKGTRTRSAEQIAMEIESLGGSIDSYSGNNSYGLSLEVMSGDFDAGLDLLADVVLNPVFPKAAFEREREVQLAALLSQRDQLLQSAGKLMRRALFGESGYGLELLGTEASLAALTPAALKKTHAACTAPDNAVLAIFGDVDPERARRAVAKAFARWRNRASLPALAATPELAKSVRVSDERDKKQAVVVMGFPGATLFAPDRFPLELIQEACSDLGSRLFTRIREKLGLAYYVGAQNFLGVTPGYFAFYAGTEPDKAAQCETEMRREAELLGKEGLTPEELKRAQAKLIGQKKISRQDLGHYAFTASLDELFGLGFANADQDDARYEAVTLEQVKAAAQKYLRPDRMVVAQIAPAPGSQTAEGPE